jgi:hypothetical protein
MQHLSEEERGRVENQLLEALEEALIRFQEAALSEREAARTKYLQAITDFTHFVSQNHPPSREPSTRQIHRHVA